MKIVAACTMIGKGDALFTDQPFSPKLARQTAGKKKLKFADGGRTVELPIESAEAAKKTDGDTLAIYVAEMDERTRAFVIGRECEIV